jgi:hypothetical protein
MNRDRIVENLVRQILNEKETNIGGPFRTDLENGPKNHGARALGNWQSDNAWDVFAPAGSVVNSYTNGTVTKIRDTGKNSGKIFGTQVSIKGQGEYPDIFYTHLKNVKLKKGDTLFIPKGTYHRVIKGNGDLVVEIKEMEDDLLVERNKSQLRNVIRTVVKDIVQIYKENNEGNFYLPEDLDEENMFYEFTDLPIPISFEVNLKPNKKIKDFKLNGEYWRNEDTISISIQYNPDGKEKHIYNLIGELNEIVGHELRHVYQKIKNTYDLEGEEEEDPFKYYTQPEEIDAQVFGFKRMARMTKKPIETIMVNWFKKNKDIHNLNVDEVKKVIKILKEHL